MRAIWKKASIIAGIFVLCLALSACKSPQSTNAENTAAAAPQGVSQNPDLVWVAKPDEGKSCAVQKGIALDTMAMDLDKSQVKIFDRKKLRDPRMRIQMCGTDRGDMNGYLIRKTDADKAAALGFKAYQSPE